MKKVSIILTMAVVSAFLFSFAVLESATWKYDSAHAKLGFSVSHMMVSETEGSFKEVDATITSTKDDFADAVVELTAKVGSIDTDNEQRDNHLKSPDFFDAEKFPTISFKSTSFKKAKEAGTYTVTGNLTMHGVTKPVTLTAIAKTGTNPMTNKTIAGFKVTGKLNRKDFGIAESTPAAMVGEEINILANAEFIKE